MSLASSQVSGLEPRKEPASQVQRTAEAKAAFQAALKSSGAALDTELQERARNIHVNEKQLTRQEKDLQKESKNLSKQSDQMQKSVDKFNKQLAPFNDLESTHADLDKDLGDIEEMLGMIEDNDFDDQDPAEPGHDHSTLSETRQHF